jgi:outer membrane protein assembly factor BamD (BamD/ComL family)
MEASPEARELHARLQQLRLEWINLKKQLDQMLETSEIASTQLDVYVESKGSALRHTDFHIFPHLISLLLDDQKVIEHQYSDAQRIALEEGGIQKLYSTDLEQGDHSLTISYGGIERNGKKYLKLLPISIHKARQRLRIILHLREGLEGPQFDYTIWQGPATAAMTDLQDFLVQRARYDAELGLHLPAVVLILSSLNGQHTSTLKNELLFYLARSYFFLQLPMESAALFQELVQRSIEPSRRSEAWFYLEKIHYQDKHFEEAIAAYRQITDDLPQPLRYEAMYLAGNSYLQLRLYDQAELIHQKIPRSSEFYPYALYAIALADLQEGETSHAISTLQKIKTHSDWGNPALRSLKAKVHQLLGYLYLEQGQSLNSMSEFTTMPLEYRTTEKTLYGKGWAAFDLGDFSGALNTFSDLKARFSQSSYGKAANLATGHLYSRLQLFNQSVEQYKQALWFFTQNIEQTQQEVEDLIQRDRERQVLEIDAVLQDFEQAKTISQRIALQLPEAMQRQQDWPSIFEQYQQLLVLEHETLQEKDRLPEGEHGLLINHVRTLQDKITQLRNDMATYMNHSSVQILKKEIEHLDDLAVQACLGIADQMAILLTGPQGAEMVLEE